MKTNIIIFVLFITLISCDLLNGKSSREKRQRDIKKSKNQCDTCPAFK